MRRSWIPWFHSEDLPKKNWFSVRQIQGTRQYSTIGSQPWGERWKSASANRAGDRLWILEPFVSANYFFANTPHKCHSSRAPTLASHSSLPGLTSTRSKPMMVRRWARRERR